MRKVKRWRYYCGFCKKSGASGGHMAKHEASCCRNPNRVCRMCKAAGDVEQKDMQTLLAALSAGGLEELTSVAETCPACILAALIQDRIANPIVNIAPHKDRGGYQPSREYIEFNFKAACAEWWGEIDNHRREMEDRASASYSSGWP